MNNLGLPMLFDKRTRINQLVKACKIYLSSELFFTELEALAFFNHNITFPFLKWIEVLKVDLLKILSQRQNDLMQKKTDTLKKYIVTRHGVNVTSPTAELGQHIISLMCENAADGMLLQVVENMISPKIIHYEQLILQLKLLPSNNL